MKSFVQAPCIKARGNHGSKKKKKKCTRGLWDINNIPTELLQEILSHLGPKSNIRASAVCKAWREAAVSVRKFPPLPWLFYRSGNGNGNYFLFDPSSSQKYEQNIPELDQGHEPIYSRGGWLLMARKIPWKLEFFLNPFTKECIYLPNRSRFFSGNCVAFSAAPTSTSCLVVSFTHLNSQEPFVVATWRPGATSWSFHRFRYESSTGIWNKCVFSKGVFYCFSTFGYVGVFDPCRATWNVLPVKRWDCPAFCQIDLNGKEVLMMEHNGNIFLISRRLGKKYSVFKLNLDRMVWEEKSGLTVFASYPASFRTSEGNRTYQSTSELRSQYYSLIDEKISRPLTSSSFSTFVAWVYPPYYQVKL